MLPLFYNVKIKKILLDYMFENRDIWLAKTVIFQISITLENFCVKINLLT